MTTPKLRPGACLPAPRPAHPPTPRGPTCSMQAVQIWVSQHSAMARLHSRLDSCCRLNCWLAMRAFTSANGERAGRQAGRQTLAGGSLREACKHMHLAKHNSSLGRRGQCVAASSLYSSL